MMIKRSQHADASKDVVQSSSSLVTAGQVQEAIRPGYATFIQGREKSATDLGYSYTAATCESCLVGVRHGIFRPLLSGPSTKAASAALELWEVVKIAESGKRKPTVAVDMDGTLATHFDKWDPQHIPDPRRGARKALSEFKYRGWKIIIFTVRGDKELIAKWLKKHDIPYDYINENPDQPPGSSGKVLADLYIDDRAADGSRPWDQIRDDAIDTLSKAAEAEVWSTVPGLVATRYKEARNIQRLISVVAKGLPTSDPGYGQVWWNPKSKEIWVSLSDADDESTHNKWHNAMKAIVGVQGVRTEAEYGPYNDPDWVRVKKGNALTSPYHLAGNLTGGPSPMSNAIVNMLLGAGTGYGLGFLAENLLPEQYIERGRLRNIAAILGAGAGAVPSFINAGLNKNIAQTAGRPLSTWQSWTTPDSQVPISPHEPNWHNSLLDGQIKHSQWLQRSTEEWVKQAYGHYDSGLYGGPGAPLQQVPVDAFNAAIWNDVHKGLQGSQNNRFGTRSVYGGNQDVMHTPPPVGAAVSGIVSGIQQQHGGNSLLSPRHFVSGLAGAGVDLVTARLAGGVLGALGGLTPDAQEKLQNMGLWGGFMRGVTKSVLGL